MRTDESGAPWPYEPCELRVLERDRPTWECPEGICVCHREREPEDEHHGITFFDGGARRMPQARCRVVENGTLINLDAPYADAAGVVTVRARPHTTRLQLEWAPRDTPEGEFYPYRRLYYLDLGKTLEEGAERRLHNLGFGFHPTVEQNVRDFQRVYKQQSTGRVEDVYSELVAFHDAGLLPPIPTQDARGPRALPEPASGAATFSLAAGPGPSAPGGPPSGSGPVVGGRTPRGSAAEPLLIRVRVRVRTRSGRALRGATVAVQAGAPPKTEMTDGTGFARFTLVEDDFGMTMPRSYVDITAMMRHHGPDPGFGTVKTSKFRVSAAVDARQLKPQSEQGLIVPDASTPGVVEDAHGRFLDVVLMDAGMNIGRPCSTEPTRRLTKEEVQRELIHLVMADQVKLTPQSEFQFDHDPATGDLDPCTDNCKVKSPAPDQRVALASATIWGVTLLHMADFAFDNGRRTDAHPVDRYRRESFVWQKEGAILLDQRHAVGMARLFHWMGSSHGIVAFYAVSLGSAKPDCHGHGLAIDFSGCSKALPIDRPERTVGTVRTMVRMGVDFMVFLHWGRIPMWDPTTVAASPSNPARSTRCRSRCGAAWTTL